jgi:hypothetical protein
MSPLRLFFFQLECNLLTNITVPMAMKITPRSTDAKVDSKTTKIAVECICWDIYYECLMPNAVPLNSK